MDNNLFERFERQIEVLLRQYEKLKLDNVKLREKQGSLLTECNELREKYSLVVGGVEKMIDRLKGIEKDSE